MAKVLQYPKNDLYQLKITLKNIKPPIWRRFVVDSNILLPDLHKVIQTIIGWTNSHLHQFVIDGVYYSEPDEEPFMEYVDYRKVSLAQVLSRDEQTIIYQYDFGDGWEHSIVLEKRLEDQGQENPFCVKGKRACPPEDCG
nr:plasmid pRiA4b ORF-3 family protein [Spirochaetaceae bacterium]